MPPRLPDASGPLASGRGLPEGVPVLLVLLPALGAPQLRGDAPPGLPPQVRGGVLAGGGAGGRLGVAPLQGALKHSSQEIKRPQV